MERREGNGEAINMRPRPTLLVLCKMCARTWSPLEDKGACDWSYVGTHQWRRYPSDNELKMWAYAVSLLRIVWKRKSWERMNEDYL